MDALDEEIAEEAIPSFPPGPKEAVLVEARTACSSRVPWGL